MPRLAAAHTIPRTLGFLSPRMMSLRARGLRAAQRAILFLSTDFSASFPLLQRRLSLGKTESIAWALRSRVNNLRS